MGREEQDEEREVLSAIFPDEITDTGEYSFHISIALDESVQNGDDPPPTFLLTVSLPEPYPDVAPTLDILPAPNSAKHPQLDLSADKPALLSPLQAASEDNLGMQMIFTLVSTLKETAEGLILARREEREQEKRQEAARKEEEENRKFQGEKVTRESFLKWRDAFRGEVEERERVVREEKEAEMKKARTKVEEKITGRQLWERGLVGKVDEEDEGLGDAVKELEIEG